MGYTSAIRRPPYKTTVAPNIYITSCYVALSLTKVVLSWMLQHGFRCLRSESRYFSPIILFLFLEQETTNNNHHKNIHITSSCAVTTFYNALLFATDQDFSNGAISSHQEKSQHRSTKHLSLIPSYLSHPTSFPLSRLKLQQLCLIILRCQAVIFSFCYTSEC